MRLNKCDNCLKESKVSNEFDAGFMDFIINLTEPEEVYKIRMNYTNILFKGDIGDLIMKRRITYEFCSLTCLKEFIINKLRRLFDDWKEYTDAYKNA